jgi:hypothetical protein
MVETILVRTDVTPAMIAAGRELVTALDSYGPKFEAAFWLMDEDNGRWHLILSTRSAIMEGSTALYAKVDKVLCTLQAQNDIRIRMVSILGDRMPVVRALRKILGTKATVDGTRLDDTYIERVWFPGCYVYRVSARQALKPVTEEAHAS